MTHATLVPQPFEKRDKKLDHNTIRKKFVTTTGSAKSSSTTSIASPTSSPGWLTRQDITKASLRNSTYQIYFHYRTLWEEYFAEKSIIYDSPAFEHFLNFFREFFYQGVSYSVLVSVNSEVTTHPSIPISNKIFQRKI